MKKFYLLLFSIFLSTFGFSQTEEDYKLGKTISFGSEILQGEVSYNVHLPYGYNESQDTYPVIFIMNGHLTSTYANAVATVENLSSTRIPDMIVIGISNTGVVGKYWSCPDDSGKVEDAETFYSFLKNELVPNVQNSYRTNGYKILMGQSNTGLYTTYNLLYYPELFDAYIVASPMFGWCKDFYFNNTRLNANKIQNKRLYISYGDMDYLRVLDHIEDYRNLLEQEAPNSLKWEIDKIDNTGHVPLVTLNNALLFFFSELTMTPERSKFSFEEIDAHFKKLSDEYGFTILPKSDALLDIAFNYRKENNLDKAIEMVDYAIKLYPKSEINYYAKGIFYYQMEDYESAAISLNKALEINPEFTRAKNLLKRIDDQK